MGRARKTGYASTSLGRGKRRPPGAPYQAIPGQRAAPPLASDPVTGKSRPKPRNKIALSFAQPTKEEDREQAK